MLPTPVVVYFEGSAVWVTTVHWSSSLPFLLLLLSSSSAAAAAFLDTQTKDRPNNLYTENKRIRLWIERLSILFKT